MPNVSVGTWFTPVCFEEDHLLKYTLKLSYKWEFT